MGSDTASTAKTKALRRCICLVGKLPIDPEQTGLELLPGRKRRAHTPQLGLVCSRYLGQDKVAATPVTLRCIASGCTNHAAEDTSGGNSRPMNKHQHYSRGLGGARKLQAMRQRNYRVSISRRNQVRKRAF